jgi:hypothetical protein
VLAVVLGGTPTPTRPAPCPAQGDATKAEIRALNEQKTRNDTPAEDDVDETVTIDGLVEPGDDSQRWQDGAAVEVVAYVVDVRDGGATSANCHSADPADHDTILEISRMRTCSTERTAVGGGDAGAAAPDGEDRRGLVDAVAARAVPAPLRLGDGLAALRRRDRGKALNTAEDAGPSIARATAWEIHPVTGLELAEEGGAETAFFNVVGRDPSPPPHDAASAASIPS